MKKLTVIIPSYNNSKWYEKNLKSVYDQDYPHYRVLYTDDLSADGTYDNVKSLVAKLGQEHRTTIIKNTERQGALENIYNMVHNCEDDEVALTLDGDDWFASTGALSRVAKEYENPDVWMTWGQYKDIHGGFGCSRPVPQFVIDTNSYRRYNWCSSHLRTFYAWLFKKIKKEDLMFQGKFAPMAWDLGFMFPLLEMSGNHGKFIPDILYIYNTENPINDSKVNLNLQQQIESYYRSKGAYPRL
jgi:glycosyltransferase involved in cell wall biosynthesis